MTYTNILTILMENMLTSAHQSFPTLRTSRIQACCIVSCGRVSGKIVVIGEKKIIKDYTGAIGNDGECRDLLLWCCDSGRIVEVLGAQPMLCSRSCYSNYGHVILSIETISHSATYIDATFLQPHCQFTETEVVQHGSSERSARG